MHEQTNRATDTGVDPTRDAPLTAEASFRIDELFFSRTDSRGRIVAGNEVFQRVSGFNWSEMMGKPHNIVRHPDMPRAVFHILWERIRDGLPTATYVLNRTKDGAPYWVFAIVSPLNDGYISVRLKPSADLHGAATAIYREVRAYERTHDPKPADSAALLLAKLADAGFPTFDAFMASAILQETRSRNAQLARETPTHVTALERLLATTGGLLAASEAVATATWEYRYVPMNLRIQAGSLGDAGNSMSIISRNYGILMQSIEEMLALFREAGQGMTGAIAFGAFRDCAARIQAEMADVFLQEQTDETGVADEIQRLQDLRDDQLRDAVSRLSVIYDCAQRFSTVKSDMDRLTSGLAAIKVMGKVESARISEGQFSALINDLEAYQQAMSQGLSDIAQVNNAVRSHLENIR